MGTRNYIGSDGQLTEVSVPDLRSGVVFPTEDQARAFWQGFTAGQDYPRLLANPPAKDGDVWVVETFEVE